MNRRCQCYFLLGAFTYEGNEQAFHQGAQTIGHKFRRLMHFFRLMLLATPSGVAAVGHLPQAGVNE